MHQSHHTMRKMLERCGVPEETLKLPPMILQTCKICRERTYPGPSNASNMEIADTFNARVECDLLFFHKQMIFHTVDRCTRWHAAMVIQGKTEEDCMAALDEL